MKDKITSIIRPIPLSTYRVNYMFENIEDMLKGFEQDFGGVNLNPDFQRGHVWTEKQQRHFMENCIRRLVPESGLTIQFNCSHFSDIRDYKGELPKEVQCIDGLQRLTAIRKFMSGDFKVFGNFYRKDLEGTDFDLKRCINRITVIIFELQTRKELLQYYLDINTGGTVHTENEIAKVKRLLAKELYKDS
jgi:hypothetical protein